jgi:hypothetical protein
MLSNNVPFIGMSKEKPNLVLQPFKPHHSNSGIPAEMIFGGGLRFAT